LLGVLGSGARNPHGILELGSQIGSIPSWQGGKIQFWAEQLGQSLGRSERTDGVGNIASLRGIYVIIVMRVHYFIKLCMLFFLYMICISCARL
jgi:hypothetical protein